MELMIPWLAGSLEARATIMCTPEAQVVDWRVKREGMVNGECGGRRGEEEGEEFRVHCWRVLSAIDGQGVRCRQVDCPSSHGTLRPLLSSLFAILGTEVWNY